MRTVEEMASIIKKLCDAKNISINKMLAESGAGARTYHNMIAGSYPSIDKIAKIADYLDCSVDYILGLSIDTDSVLRSDLSNLFWERFYEMCVLKGTKPNPVADKIGISSGIVTKWKMEGTLPNGEKLIKIANHLDCSVDYLLGRTNNPNSHKIPVKRNISVSPSTDTELQVAYGFKSSPVIQDNDDIITSK